MTALQRIVVYCIIEDLLFILVEKDCCLLWYRRTGDYCGLKSVHYGGEEWCLLW